MSHRWDCPSRWEAEREGEDAFRRCERENPHEDRYGREGCPEAAKAWDEGFRYAERRDEERRAEEAASEQLAHERAMQAHHEEERQLYEAQQQYPEPPMSEPERRSP